MGPLPQPVDPELGPGSSSTNGGNDHPPPYEEIIENSVKDDEGLPTYEEAVSSVSKSSLSYFESW